MVIRMATFTVEVEIGEDDMLEHLYDSDTLDYLVEERMEDAIDDLVSPFIIQLTNKALVNSDKEMLVKAQGVAEFVARRNLKLTNDATKLLKAAEVYFQYKEVCNDINE